MKNDINLHACASQGREWMRSKPRENVDSAIPYILTSDSADCWLIGCWADYWMGAPVSAIHRSTGHSFKVEIKFRCLKVKVVNPTDHRDGITIVKEF